MVLRQRFGASSFSFCCVNEPFLSKSQTFGCWPSKFSNGNNVELSQRFRSSTVSEEAFLVLGLVLKDETTVGDFLKWVVAGGSPAKSDFLAGPIE